MQQAQKSVLMGLGLILAGSMIKATYELTSHWVGNADSWCLIIGGTFMVGAGIALMGTPEQLQVRLLRVRAVAGMVPLIYVWHESPIDWKSTAKLSVLLHSVDVLLGVLAILWVVDWFLYLRHAGQRKLLKRGCRDCSTESGVGK